MTPYRITYSFYYDDKLVRQHGFTMLTDTPIHSEDRGDSFEGLWDICNRYGSVSIPLYQYESKRGKRYMKFYNAIFSRITPKNCKSWKFTVYSREIPITIKELMKFDTENVIQYLKERGITTCPMNF